MLLCRRRSIPAAIAIGTIALVGGQLILDRVLGFATEPPVVIEFVGGVFFIILIPHRKGLLT